MSQKKPIAIYGAGGLGREVLALLNVLPEWQVVGFFDDGLEKGTRIQEITILGGVEALRNWKESLSVVLAIGNPSIKKKIFNAIHTSKILSFPVVIHPQALIMDLARVKVGEGTILTAGCVLTTGIQIGKHVLVNLNATIGHDCVVDDFSSIMPGVNLAGQVHIQQASLIGSGANVLTGINIGSNTIVGAGSVVTKSVSDNEKVAGVPARSIKKDHE